MVSGQRVLLIVAADRRELAGFAEARPIALGLRWSALAEAGGGRSLCLVAHGPGRANAAAAVRAARRVFECEGVVSTGYSGALAPELKTGDLFAARIIYSDADPGLEYAVDLPSVPSTDEVRSGVLLTLDRVAQTAQEKRTLRQRGADAVDMEAAGVAAEARLQDLPFSCLRVISDAADVDFPVDFNRARRADGTFSAWRVLAQAGWRPERWRRLMELGRVSRQASAKLAPALRRWALSWP